MVVTCLVGASAIRRTMRISIGPRGRPQGSMAPWTTTTPPNSSTPSLAAPIQLALPSSEADPLDSDTPLDLKSMCGNRLLRWFTHFTSPTGKGQASGSWDSTVGLSRLAVEEEGERRQGTRASGYGSASEEVSKRRSNRSDDGKAFNAGEDNEASGSVEYSCGGGTMWCAVRVNPNHHTGQPPLIPPLAPNSSAPRAS
jgi:hypothetical protein